MADIGVPELLIILAIVIILFGPSRLTGLGKSLGQGIREFRSGIRDGEEPAGATAASGVVDSATIGALPELPPVEPLEEPQPVAQHAEAD